MTPAIIIALLWASLWLAVANAAEPRVSTWVIYDETADKPYEGKRGVHHFTSATACNVDIGGVAKITPSGSRLSCRRVSN